MKPSGVNESRESNSFTSYVLDSYISAPPTQPSPSSRNHKLPASQDLEALTKSKDVKKLKRFIRTNHWPSNHEIRKTLWLEICSSIHGSQQKNFDTYTELVKEILGEDLEDQVAPLPLFVDSCRLEQYGLSREGTRVARRILCVVAHERPDIVYCPALYPLVCLLLHYMSETDCHHYVIKMIRSKERYFSQTRSASEAWPLVLSDLTKKYASSSYKQICKAGFAVESVLQDWIWWILLKLPFSYLVRVVDVFLNEGLKFLYRIALSILIHFRKSSSQIDFKTRDDLCRRIEEFCSTMPVSIEKLFKTAYDLRGLSRSEIWKLTTKKEIYVQSKHNVEMLKSSLPQSPSAGSLNSGLVKGTAGSQLLKGNETVDGRYRARSNSHDTEFYPLFIQAKSAVMVAEQWKDLYGWIPKRFTLKQPKILFSTAEHGTSLATFYNRVEGHEPTFIAIKTRKAEVIGAYCSVDWIERKSRSMSYFGTGESFVCKFLPQPGVKYSWVGISLGENTPNSAHLFMSGDSNQISIGGGNGVAILLDENMLRGRSERCDTYNNDPLTEAGQFDVTILEVFGFE